MNTNWEKRINHIINYLNRSKKNPIRFFIVFIIFLVWLKFYSSLWWLIFLSLLVLYGLPKNTFYPRRKKAVSFLNKALENLKNKKYADTLSCLMKANELFPNHVLQDLIKDFSDYYDISEYSEIRIIEQELNKAKDKKVKKILEELKKVLVYLNQHSENLIELQQKINNLKKEYEAAPENYKDQVQTLISRYENLKQLEESKIDFYKQAKNELWKLHKDYLFRNKIKKEWERLEKLENQYLSDSVRESFEADEKTSFIDYENAYLEALSEYADQINYTSSSDMFDEIKQQFEMKKQQLKNS